jgi:diaminopimelate epimerase
MVGAPRSGVRISKGDPFWKMSGSGNDFVFFDARGRAPYDADQSDVIGRVCARSTGVGADGVVFMEDDGSETFKITYLNRDGSLAELCGNASLCSTRLAVHLGIAGPAGFRFRTDAGAISARMAGDDPEIDLKPARGLELEPRIPVSPGESRIGYADTGVPHLVVAVEELDSAPVVARGRELRHDKTLPAGANVNFVAKTGDGRWGMRTYERGVEAETLACGTGAVACALLLRAWGLVDNRVEIISRSGRLLVVSLREVDGRTYPSLRGEGRLVFTGTLGDV